MNSESPASSAPVALTRADRVLLKVCGVTRPDQAVELRKIGVDLLGLNFHPKSPRYVAPETARSIVQAWSDPASVVGVFVDRPAADVLETLHRAGVAIVQLHGDETAATVAEVARRVPVIRAFRIRDARSIEAARGQIAEIEAAGAALLAVLIDGYSPDAHGGTGHAVAEELVRSASDLHPRVILAGGLRPGNLRERLAWIRPWCVDVASGVETSPGIKDPVAVEAMARCVRETCRKID